MSRLDHPLPSEATSGMEMLCRISIENSFLIPARKQVLRNWFKGAWKQFENKI